MKETNKLSAKEFWKERFDEYPQTDADKLAVAMMAEYHAASQATVGQQVGGTWAYVPCDENDSRCVGGFTSNDGQSLCHVKVEYFPLTSPATVSGDEKTMTEKVREYFKSKDPKELIKEWEDIGYEFEDIIEQSPVSGDEVHYFSSEYIGDKIKKEMKGKMSYNHPARKIFDAVCWRLYGKTFNTLCDNEGNQQSAFWLDIILPSMEEYANQFKPTVSGKRQ